MAGVHWTPSHQRQGAIRQGSGYQFAGWCTTETGAASWCCVAETVSAISGPRLDHHRRHDLVVPRLTPRVPERGQVVENVGDQQQDVEQLHHQEASHAPTHPDGAARACVTYRDAERHLPYRLAALRSIHQPVVEDPGD